MKRYHKAFLNGFEEEWRSKEQSYGQFGLRRLISEKLSQTARNMQEMKQWENKRGGNMLNEKIIKIVQNQVEVCGSLAQDKPQGIREEQRNNYCDARRE